MHLLREGTGWGHPKMKWQFAVRGMKLRTKLTQTIPAKQLANLESPSLIPLRAEGELG